MWNRHCWFVCLFQNLWPCVGLEGGIQNYTIILIRVIVAIKVRPCFHPKDQQDTGEEYRQLEHMPPSRIVASTFNSVPLGFSK